MTLGLKVVVALLFVIGLFFIAVGLIGITGGNVDTIIGSFFFTAGINLLLIGVIHLVVAFYLWKKNSYAMYAASTIAILNILTIFLLNVLGLIVGGVMLYYLWIDRETKNLFQK